MNKLLLFLFLLACGQQLQAQPYAQQLAHLEQQLQSLAEQQTAVEQQIEAVKLSRIRDQLRELGLPGKDYVEHQAMFLSYSEAHEQARWVAHLLSPDIIHGTHSRTNDFREDTLIASGTAVQADYFLTDT
ncbi:MAG: DNA/RNA non-specific endonuclease, partial [Bacteroidetes bacterium]